MGTYYAGPGGTIYGGKYATKVAELDLAGLELADAAAMQQVIVDALNAWEDRPAESAGEKLRTRSSTIGPLRPEINAYGVLLLNGRTEDDYGQPIREAAGENLYIGPTRDGHEEVLMNQESYDYRAAGQAPLGFVWTQGCWAQVVAPAAPRRPRRKAWWIVR